MAIELKVSDVKIYVPDGLNVNDNVGLVLKVRVYPFKSIKALK